MEKYCHGGDIYRNKVKIDFSVNTNPLGISENVKRAVIDSHNSFGVYPDSEYELLRNSIAKKENVFPSNVVCSNGASEMIYAAVRTVMPKKAILPAPTFSEYERALKSIGCEVSYYKLKEDNGFNLDEGFINASRGMDMTFICNPNNPTGAVADRKIIENIKCICIVDECFADFSKTYSMKGTMPVIKAFTKTYAMAGLRLGYMICDEDFAKKVKKQLPMWNVSSPAQAAGIAALKEDKYINESTELIKKERKYLTDELLGLGYKVFPSEANFILFKGENELYEKLLQCGILIRKCENFIGLNEHFYRIAVKTHEENIELIRKLGEISG